MSEADHIEGVILGLQAGGGLDHDDAIDALIWEYAPQLIAEVRRLQAQVAELEQIGVKKRCSCGHGVYRCTWCGCQPGAAADGSE